MFPRSMIFFLLLSLLMKHSATITYRCDDDQIIVVQNFGNDTIRMHCQKPTLCGFQFLKCHYNHLQSYCGGKTNFVAHLQQSTPISPVIHTCCNLTINEDVQIKAHIGNDCFLYDLPDGSNGTTGEDLEKEDKEGYMLLRNINKLPGQFANFSGYHLRFYLLRNKGMSQNVVKGVERNELGYRITICSIQCRDSVGRRKGMIYENDEKNEEKQVIRDDKHIDLNKKEQIFNDNNLNQVKLTIRNLTDDGQWLFVTWAEWSYKQWSERSTIHKIELNELDGTKRRNRCGIHETDTEIKTNTEKGQEKSERIKMFMQKLNRVREGFRDCDDDEDYTDELKKNNVEQEEQKLGEDSKELGYDYSKKELAIKSAEKQNFSELDVEENLKSESNSHKINETEEEMDLFVNPVTRREEIENQTKDHFEKMKENTLSDDGNNLKTPTIRATIHCNISITKEVRSGHDDISSIKKTSESEEKDISTIKHRDDVDLMNTSQSYLNEKQLLAEKKKQKDEVKEQTKSSTNDESNFENQTSHATRSSCPCNISTTKEVRTGDDDISNMTKTTESKEENISTTNHRKDDDLMSTTQSHLNTKQLLGKKKVEEDEGEKQAKSSTAKSKLPSKELSTNGTITHKNETCKELKEKPTSKQKISDKKSESQHGKKKHHEPKPTLKPENKQLPESNDSVQPVVASGRKSHVGHDPVPIPAAIGAEKVPVARAQVILPGMNCFSADTKVYTQNGEKTMKEIVVGDFVLVPVSKNQLRYERVEMFYHREPETRAKFVVLETESGRKLSLTELHLLPLGDCEQMHESTTNADIIDQWLRKSKFAYKARMGDCVFTITSNHKLQVDRIVKVGRQYLKGVYSPMTVEGSIVVDGVLASCFSQVESHFAQKLVYDFLVFLRRIFGRLMQSLDEPIQHLPTFINSIHNLGRFAVPFVKY